MSLFSAQAPRASTATSNFSKPSIGLPLGAATPPPQAVALLGEVLARISGVEKPVLQILASSAGCTASQVAYDFSVASTCHFGRTLLVSAVGQQAEDLTGARALSRRMTEWLGGQASEITPDTFVAGLYHAPLPAEANPAKASQAILAWREWHQDFRMIVIDSPAIAYDPRGLAWAAGCTGCLLTVTAGLTRADEVRSCERQLRSAGLLVLGTVLHDAPAFGLGLRRRRGPM